MRRPLRHCATVHHRIDVNMAAKKLLAVVTGANQGIGYHIAEQVGALGSHKVILACRRPQAGEEAAAALRAKGCDAVAAPLDVTCPTSIATFAEYIKAQHDGVVDVLFNNAGIAFKSNDPTPHEQQARPVIQTNLTGPITLTSALTPYLRAAAAPRVITTASQLGLLRVAHRDKHDVLLDPSLTVEQLQEYAATFVDDVEAHGVNNAWSTSNYGMSKVFVIGWVRIMARLEAALQRSGDAHPITYACFCPGYCNTSMTSGKGPRPPSVGAQTGVWLGTSADAASIAGHFYVDQRQVPWK